MDEVVMLTYLGPPGQAVGRMEDSSRTEETKRPECGVTPVQTEGIQCHGAERWRRTQRQTVLGCDMGKLRTGIGTWGGVLDYRYS